MDITRLIELLSYNKTHRRRLSVSVVGHLAAGQAWYKAFIASRLVTAEKLADALSRYYRLHRWEHGADQPIDVELRHLIPARFAKKVSVAPIRVVVHRLALAVVDPTQVEIFDVISRNTCFPLKLCVATPADVASMQDRLYGAITVVERADRRWSAGEAARPAAYGKKLERYIGVNLSRGIPLPADTPSRLNEEGPGEQLAADLHLVDSRSDSIENIYTLDEMPSLNLEE